jgi:GMP synthase (glutamine-hydrolysing)
MKAPSVLALQHVAVEPPAGIEAAIVRAGASLRTIRIDRGEGVPDDMGAFSGLVVMGGPMGVYEGDLHPHLAAEKKLIERALDASVPILGICLGSQLLASVLGADVRPGPHKELGFFPVTLEPDAERDPLFAGAPESFTALHWHGDIFDLPSRAVPLARSALTRHQAFSFGGSAYGLLFHLEVAVAQVQTMADAFANELAGAGVAPGLLLGDAHAHGPHMEAIGARVFDRWMTLVSNRNAG